MPRNLRQKAVCVVIAMLGHFTLTATRADAGAGPSFEPAPCPFTPAADQVEGVTLNCGFALMPENRLRPEGRWIRLAVAIFNSSTAVVRPPLVLLGGGPGTVVLDTFGPIITGAAGRDFTAGRDLVMFDQRGVGHSQPALQCPELSDLALHTLGMHLTRDQETEGQVEAAFACRDRLVASGIDLAAYDTAASAADVNDLRVALGYGQLDIWGISYGTRLALAVERDFPAAVHSLVLDSALPPSVNQVTDRAANAERAFRALFDGCAADPVCAAAYPNLEDVFYDLVAEFNETPASFFTQDPRTGAVYYVVLTGDRLVRTLTLALTDASLIPFVPLVAASIRAGDFTLMSQATSLLTFGGRGQTIGMFYSVNCADEVSRTSQAQLFAARRTVRPEIVDALSEDARLRICAGWGAAQVPRRAEAPVVSDVPTLVLAGEYDPLTPPSYGEIAGRTLTNSSQFHFPGIGHAVVPTSPCGRAIMIGFLSASGQAPDAHCLAGMGTPAWVVPPP
jgi:pimeloyl-ACP methyl ester carboxylesterase